MKKSDMRAWLLKFFEQPKNRWEAKMKLIDKGLSVIVATMISWAAFINNNGPTLVLLILIGILTFSYIYFFIAKGR